MGVMRGGPASSSPASGCKMQVQMRHKVCFRSLGIGIYMRVVSNGRAHVDHSSLREMLASRNGRWGCIPAYPSSTLSTSGSLLLLLRHIHVVWVHLTAHTGDHALSCEVGRRHHRRAVETRSSDGRSITIALHSRLEAVHLRVELSLTSQQLLVLHLLRTSHALHVGHEHGPTSAHRVLFEAVGIHARGALEAYRVEARYAALVESTWSASNAAVL